MDFSKIKKILYILMIISILLSLKTKVFGAYEFKGKLYDGSDTTYILPDEFLNYKYVFYMRERWNGFLVASNSEIYYFNNGSFAGAGVKQKNTDYLVIQTSSTEVTDLSNFPLKPGTASAYINDASFYSIRTSSGLPKIVASNYNVKNSLTNEVIFDNTNFIYPFFDNVTEIENGYPDGVYISRGDYSENENLYFHLLQITYINNTVEPSIYYYNDNIFLLNKNSKYYKTFINDSTNSESYYNIPRSELSLNTDSNYLYVLSNSSESFNNSSGILDVDVPLGIYDVISSDTTGVITSQDSTNDKIQNIDDTLNDNIVSSDTESNIEDSLNFDNQNDGLNNLNSGFFSRLTTMLSNLLGYNLGDDTSVTIPLPNSNKSIVLHSKDIYDNVTGVFRLIINAFWVYVFSFYMWKFINKIYIAVSTGNILDTFSSSGEAITNDML